MFKVSEAFNKEINKLQGRKFNAKVIIRDKEYSGNQIYEMNLEESVNPSDSFSIGSICSNSFDIKLINTGDIFDNAIVKPYVGLYIGDDIEYIPLGVFTVIKTSVKGKFINLECVDNMLGLEKVYFSDLSYPADINDIAKEICKKAGVNLASKLPNYRVNKIEGYSLREAIGFIASLCGSFARFNRIGDLEVRDYEVVKQEMTPHNLFKLDIEANECIIKKVIAKKGEEELSTGTDDGNKIVFNNPIITKEILSDIYTKYNGFKYIPYTAKWKGNPAIMAGDILNLTDLNGNKYNALIMEQKFTYKNGISSEVKAKGKTRQDSSFDSKGSVAQSMERYSIEQANIKKALIDKASINDLTAVDAKIQRLYTEDLTAIRADIVTLNSQKANIIELNSVRADLQQAIIGKANIVDLNSAVGKINVLESKTASIDNLLSQKASINDLNALNATISDALIKKATIAQLEALETKTNKLIADKANIKDLNVANANINKIQAETANIKTLLNGNLSSENIQAGGITSDKLTIANGFITNLMISSVSASKITAGTIDAAKINVVNLNADNLTVGKINGQLLKDGSISGLAIENGAIDNNKVSPNANIEASKINISSVVTAINEGSTLLTANKVTIDSEKGTLDVAFNNLNTSLEANKKITESNSTAINVVQGKLSASIENSKVLESKQKTLEDNYNRTVITVDSLKNTVGQQKTLIDSATGKITSVEVKANTLEKNLSGLTQTVTDTKKVIENNKTVLESKNAELKANIDSVSSSLSSVSSTVDKNNKTLVVKTNTLEQNLNGLTQRVESNKTVTDGKITSVENEAHELKVGLGGLTSKLDTLKSTTDGINKTVSNQGSVINQLKDSINLKVDSSTFTQSTQTINNNINRAKEQAIIGARSIPDTRNDNQSPGWYIEHYPFQSITEFKYSNVIQIPNGGYQYGTLETKVPWNNSSGGYPTQVFRSNSFPTYQRHGTDLNTWSSWEHIEDTQGSQAKANNALNNAKSYSDSKKQEAIKAAENLALEKSNLAKKYADEVATAKANLAQANAIANADGKITEEERKRIQQAQENLNTAISKADKAKQDAISEANRVAELKKQEAINSANSHADSKANEALNNAKVFVNAEITTVKSHLNKATAEINVLKEKIESKVSQSDIDKSIQEIKIGGINLLRNSDYSKYSKYENIGWDESLNGSLRPYLWSDYNRGGSNPSEGYHAHLNITKFSYPVMEFNCVSTSRWLGSSQYFSPGIIKPNCEYTFSIYLYGDSDTSECQAGLDYFKNGSDRQSFYSGLNKFNIKKGEWNRYEFTFKTSDDLDVSKSSSFYIYGYYKIGKFYCTKSKLEEGKFATGYSKAPEDMDQLIIDNIKTVTDKITTVESKFTQENNSIKASVQDLNSTTQSITTNVSNINRDLTSKINSNLDAAKSFATDIAIAKANLAKEQAIANADGKITAEEQKRIQQAQTNLNTAIAKATEAETKAKSYADVKKQEAINSANNNTNNAINNIKIGGRNYGLNTDVMQQEPYNIIFSKDLVFEKGKTYTISMDFDLENLVKGSQERVGCEGSILFKDGTRQYIGVWHWISQGATFKGRKSYTFTIENKDIKDNMTSIHIYTELVSSGKRNLGRFKIEEGNKATDYTIAPEDLQSYADKVAKAKADLAQANAIANADGKITEEERKRIQQARENLNTAIARADKAKQDAINTASTDATNKANNALNSAKAFVNAEITTVNNKVHNVESNLNILKDQIKSKVSQSDIEKNISEMKIGGRNLLPLTPRNYISAHMSIWNWGFANRKISELGLKVGDKITFSIWSKFGNVQTGGRARISFYDIKNNNIKTVSNSDTINPNEEGFSFVTVEIPPNTETIWVGLQRGNPVGDGALEFDFLIKMPKLEIGTKATDWTPAPEDTNSLIADSIKVVDTKIRDVSSSVTQLRDSVTTQINSINSKTHTIETTLGGKASKQEVTEVNNRVTTIKASLDGITQRVSATESKTQTLESNINGKASKQEVNNVSSKVVSLETNLNGITNRVSNTESRINTLDGKVASAVTNQQFTEFKQSNDKFKFTVEQRSSVSNILPNSSFFGGDRGWLHDGVEFWYGSYSGYGFKGRMTGAIKNRTSYNNPERFLQTHKAYKVKKNTTYTISFHYACEMNIHSMEAYVVLSDTEHGDYAQPIRILEKPGGTQSDPNNDIPFTYKFNTGNHEWVWLRFDHNGMKSGTNWDQYCWLYVSEIGIYEGDVGAVKWTPKGGEVYSANYQMDGLGFKGTFEDGTYASLGKDGLEWYNAGTGHAYHALTYVTSFDIPVGNPGKAYIKLPAEFTKRRSSLKWTVALRGYYYSTSGNFFPFHVHCTGSRDYIENGLVVCEVQGLCKIQNGSNSGDVQFRPLTAMLIAIA
ncbi:MAG: hypothetical protein E7J71_06800 [Clostridium perfringens]|nr:hypothetical protein [Clostridium perfringens]